MSSLKITIKKFFRNKLNYLILILIGICCAFSIIVNSLTYSTKEYYKDNVLNWADYRIFSILHPENREKLINKLNSMEEVIGVFDEYGYYTAWYMPDIEEHFEGKEITVRISGVAGEIPAVKGENLPATDEDVMICPITYRPLENLLVENTKLEFDLTPFIGKEMTIVPLESRSPGKDDIYKEFKIKLVGLYDNDRLNNFYHDCYTNYNTLAKIRKQVTTIKNNSHIYFQIDDKINEEKVISELKKSGYFAHSVMDIDYVLAVDSFDTLEYIGKGLFIISMLIVLCLFSYNLFRNKKIIKLNKILGYSNIRLLFNSIIETILLFINSCISLIIFLLVGIHVFKNYLPDHYPSFKQINLIISPLEFKKVFIVLIFIIAFIFIINIISLLLGKSNRKNII